MKDFSVIKRMLKPIKAFLKRYKELFMILVQTSFFVFKVAHKLINTNKHPKTNFRFKY